MSWNFSVRTTLMAAGIAVALLGTSPRCLAYGSITWTEVEGRVAKSDPSLVQTIEQQFLIDPSGGGVMPAHMGNERVAPYTFFATRRSNGKRYRLDIDESDDFEFTHRWKFSWQESPKE